MARLVVRSGPHAGRALPLDGEPMLVGRGPEAGLRLEDEAASREHALIGFDGATGAWTVEDLQSTNGTRLNGRRVRSGALADGDEIRIGRTALRFELEEPAAGG